MCKRLLFFMFVAASIPLFGMDNIDGGTVQGIMILNNYLDYNEQCTFARLDKKCNKTIEDKYRKKKKIIEGAIRIPEKVSWNGDFTRCAWLDIEPIENNRKSWGLTLVGLAENGSLIKQHKTWDGFYFPAIEGNDCPFFNTVGHACFRGYADAWINQGYFSYGNMIQSVIESSITITGNVYSYRCFIRVDDEKKSLYPFEDLLNYPILAKAVLQSTKMDRFSRTYEDGGDYAQQYWISGVCIPENYQYFKWHAGLNKDKRVLKALCNKGINAWEHFGKYLSYDDLPDELKNAFDAKYAEQQQEKKEHK